MLTCPRSLQTRVKRPSKFRQWNAKLGILHSKSTKESLLPFALANSSTFFVIILLSSYHSHQRHWQVEERRSTQAHVNCPGCDWEELKQLQADCTLVKKTSMTEQTDFRPVSIRGKSNFFCSFKDWYRTTTALLQTLNKLIWTPFILLTRPSIVMAQRLNWRLR